MIYSYTLVKSNVYAYVIYLIFMIGLLYVDIRVYKKSLKYNYYIQILILILNMIIFTGEYITIYTIFLTIISRFLVNILNSLRKRNRFKLMEKQKTKLIGFYLCTCNIIVTIVMNFMSQGGWGF